MSYMTVKFLDKEYSFPEDVLSYIDLLDFTGSVQKALVNAFVRKLKSELNCGNVGCLDDKDLAADIDLQVGRFIAKLCDNGIFTRTISDYLRDNKGYKLFSDVNKAALEKMKSLLIQEMDAWQAGYEDAVNRAESHVTGMGFSIWSSSFVNHAIYAAMEASTLNKQSKEAESQYQKDMNDLRSRLDSKYGGEKSNYINNTYIPNMETALTVFAYELLDKYVADLIANGKFDRKALEYIDIGRSNDLLKNLTLSHNKKAILEAAFAACPFNIAMYMQAMKYDLLDFDSFQTAKIFKQSDAILAFLRANWGEASYPTKFNIDSKCVSLLALFTGKTTTEILKCYTEKYSEEIVNAYANLSTLIADPHACRKIIRKHDDKEIVAGDSLSNMTARSFVGRIVRAEIWDKLIYTCGHTDLLDRIREYVPENLEIGNKNDLDVYFHEQLVEKFETARKGLVEKIIIKQQEEERQRIEKEHQREIQKAEQEKQAQERRKRNKKIVAMISPIIAIAVAFIIILNTVIIPWRVAQWGKKTVRETISAEYRHTVALKTNGTVVAVGDDNYGRTDVSDWTDIIAVSAGGNYTLGLKADGSVVAVGADNDDKCEVGKWKGIVAIAAGTNHSVGLKLDGTVVATGRNKYNQCDVSGWRNIVAIAVGDHHTVGLKSNGTVVTTVGPKYATKDWSDIVAISAAESYTLGLKSDGTVVTAGSGNWGFEIEAVEEWSDIIAISASDQHILGLKSNGRVVAVGDNDEGQCNVSGWKNIVAIAAGYEHSVGLQADGTVVTTGANNHGQCNVSSWKGIKLPPKADS